MAPRALDLMRYLQSDVHDAPTLAAVKALFPDVRAGLEAAGETGTLTEIRGLLEAWAHAAAPSERAEALVLAAGVAEGAERARLLRVVGQLRLEQAGDVDGAIAVYEEALDADAEVTLTRELADLYALRGGEGDGLRAADLYAALADIAGGAEGVPLLEKALDLAPGHGEALALLEAGISEAERPVRLRARWEAYVAATDDEEGTAARRLQLAQVDAADGRYRDALLWIAPLVDRGDSTAQRLKETFLAGLASGAGAQGAPTAQASSVDRPLPARALSPRSGQTMVGFKVPGVGGADATLEAVERARRALVAQAEAAAAEEASAAAAQVRAADAERAANAAAVQAAAAAAPAPATRPEIAATMLGLPQTGAAPALVSAIAATQPAIAVPPTGFTAPAGRPASTRPSAPASNPFAVTPQAAPRGPLRSSAPAPPHAFPPTAAVTPQQTASWPPVGLRASAPAPNPFAAASPQAVPRPSVPAAPRPSQPVVFSTATAPSRAPRSPFLDDEDLLVARRRVTLPDKRWLVGGGVGIAAILLFVIPWGGGETPPAAPDSRSSSVPATEPAPPPPTFPPPAPVPPAPPVVPAPAPPTVAKPATTAEPEPAHGSGKSAGASRARADGSVTLAMNAANVKGGKLTTKGIASALKPKLSAFERCYDRALERAPNLDGRLVLKWTVRAKGRAGDVKKASGTIDDTKLVQCEAGVVRDTHFPDPGRRTAEVRMGFEHTRGGKGSSKKR